MFSQHHPKTGRDYKKRMKYLVTTVALLSILYLAFRAQIYKWSCESEEITSSCAIYGMIMEDQDKITIAKKYFKMACSKNYGLGCLKMAKLEERLGNIQEADKYFKLACDAKIESGCKN